MAICDDLEQDLWQHLNSEIMVLLKHLLSEKSCPGVSFTVDVGEGEFSEDGVAGEGFSCLWILDSPPQYLLSLVDEHAEPQETSTAVLQLLGQQFSETVCIRRDTTYRS